MAASRKSRLAQLPAHPAFPLVAALWLATLIGLGVLVAALRSLPHLGIATLAVITLLGAMTGALVGLLSGRKIYRSRRPVVARPARPVERRRKPIYAHAELGEGGLDHPVEETPEAQDAELLLDTVLDTAGEDAVRLRAPAIPENWENWQDLEANEAPADLEETMPEADPFGGFAAFAREQQPEEPDEDLPKPREAQAFAEPAYGDQASDLDNLSLLQLARRVQATFAAYRAARPDDPPPQPRSGVTPGMASRIKASLLALGTARASETTSAPGFAPPPASPPPATPLRVKQDTDRPETNGPDTNGPDISSQAQAEPNARAVQQPARKPFLDAEDLMAALEDEDEPEDESALGETYSSLLAMTASVRSAQDQPVQDNESQPVNSAQDPAQTLATLDQVSTLRTAAPAPVRKLDPKDQALRDALMNLQQFTQHS